MKNAFVAQVSDELRTAVADIRVKLFEEAWFGRPVTQDLPRPAMSVEREGDRQLSFEDLWGREREGQGKDGKALEPHERNVDPLEIER